MSYFEDLQPCTAFPGEWRNLVAVGWLAKGHEYTRGPVDRALVRALGQVNPWQPPDLPEGVHRCDLCDADQPIRAEGGVHFIPGKGVLYVAPRMITHYIREHGYAPPVPFASALLACPDLADATYTAAIGRHWTRPSLPRDERSILSEPLDPVRVRPGMYIGGTRAQGLEHLVFELVGNSFDQHLAGTATRLWVDIDQEGWVTVEDDGAGISTEVLPDHGRSFLELTFTTLHFTPTLDGHHPHVHLRAGQAGVGVSVVSALSERLEVESRHAGVTSRAALERGRMVEPLTRLDSGSREGTRIRYLPDNAIFTEPHDLEAIERRLRQLAGLTPKLELHFQGRSLQRSEGLSGWVRELAPDAVTETAMFAHGTHQDVGVETAFAWSPSGKRPRILSFVNCSETVRNGSHTRGLLAAVGAVPLKKGDRKKVLKGLVAVVHVTMLHPRFEGPTKWELSSDEARVAVREIVGEALAAAPWWWDRLHEAIG